MIINAYFSIKVLGYLSIVSFFLGLPPQTSDKYSVHNGEISFVSNAELELISASSQKLQGIIDASTNQFAFTVPINSFKGFNSELQRIHFNEKYLESDKYPDATFSGKIIEQIDFSKDGTYELRAKGYLDIHGQKQIRIIKSKLVVNRGSISIESSFKVPLADHNISIPKIVNQKIATEIVINVSATLNHQNKEEK
jgi:polyisoprenoid-binding protein YceI